MSDAEIVSKFKERVIRQFLDLLVLKELAKKTEVSGYSVIQVVLRRHHILLSAGNSYSTLYFSARANLV